MKENVASKFFAHNPLMIRHIARTCEAAEQYPQSLFDFSKEILNFRLNMIEKQGIIALTAIRIMLL